MNLVKCEIRSVDGVPSFVHPTFTLPFDASVQQRLGTSSATEVFVGVRPADMRIAPRQEPGGVKATIFATELLGSDLLVEVDLGADRVRVLTDTDYAGDMGDTCFVAFDQSRLHVFDVATGQALCHGTAFDGH